MGLAFVEILHKLADASQGGGRFRQPGKGQPDVRQLVPYIQLYRHAELVGPAGQGIAAGEFDELIRAIKSRSTYVNVHSDAFPGGEIRGQIKGRLGRDDHDDDDEDED